MLKHISLKMFVGAHKGSKNCWVRAQVCARSLTQSAKFEPLLIKSSHSVFVVIVKQVDVNESTDINQSISMNLFYPIYTRSFDFHPRGFFSTIHHNLKFSTNVRRFCHSNKWKAWNLCCSILKLCYFNNLKEILN